MYSSGTSVNLRHETGNASLTATLNMLLNQTIYGEIGFFTPGVMEIGIFSCLCTYFSNLMSQEWLHVLRVSSKQPSEKKSISANSCKLMKLTWSIIQIMGLIWSVTHWGSRWRDISNSWNKSLDSWKFLGNAAIVPVDTKIKMNKWKHFNLNLKMKYVDMRGYVFRHDFSSLDLF